MATADEKKARAARLAEAIAEGVKPPGSQPTPGPRLGKNPVTQFAYREAVLREYSADGITPSLEHSHKPSIQWMLLRSQKGNSANITCWLSGKTMFTGCVPVALDAITEADIAFAEEVVAGIKAAKEAAEAQAQD